MANIDNPGFRPADRKPSEELMFDVYASNATAIYVGDVVDVASTGGVTPSSGGGTNPEYAVGVVVALYDENGIPVGAPGSAVATKYLTATTAGKALVALALPGRRFIAQTQTGQTPAATAVFATTDLVAGSGTTATAKSGHELTYSDLNTGGQLLILGLVASPDNTYAAHADLYVCFNECIFGCNGKAAGV
ncbi:hypothetical protein M0R04_11850 [Candidatus Dojkabacteria bacterium]|jgi:hypothetical protein|nr:hypothetical protein [Candidatus Dojkabacteria bacterium]